MKKHEYLEYRDEPLESILDYKGLRKSIKDFKEDKALEVLWNFVDEDNRFLPISPNEKGEAIDLGIHNIGIFSTAVCLETIAAYRRNVIECRKKIRGVDWVWDKTNDRRTGNKDRRTKNIDRILPTTERRGEVDDRRSQMSKGYGYEKAIKYFEFIINGLNGDRDVKYGFLAKITSLVRFSNYLKHWDIKDNFIDKIYNEETKNKFYQICLDCILESYDRFSTKKESIHPFEIYRFLQFVDNWGKEIWNILETDKILDVYLSNKTEENNFKNRLGEINNKLLIYLKNKIGATDTDKVKDIAINIKAIISDVKNITEINKLKDINGISKVINIHKLLFDYIFDEVYLFAKYELYRQMSLKQSGDSKLYDPKRLIYALLIVYLDNKFSNVLIRNKALEIIFSQYKNDKNAIWATGQQVTMSKDGLMIITDNECVCDLLGCEALNLCMLGFVKELKHIYDGYARTKRLEKGKILGWYPIHQRDKTPTSWTTAFTLSFIKRFCKLISLELSRRAKERFRSNYRKPNILWSDIFDSTTVKAKIRLMFPEGYHTNEDRDITNEDRDIVKECKYRTAILFGPPGTGKTTYARALATKLGLDYLELTPGDFFAGGEDSILVTINDIFEHLLHLKNTIVFIDEIDDLVKDRNQTPNQPYDRRSLFVNSLLPRFQELHDNENIILLMATNNIEGVDDAITRMGRVDLVIPVGAISPHGRLKYLHDFYRKYEDVFSKLGFLSSEVNDELINLEIEYINATEAFNFITLKSYTDKLLEEIMKYEMNDQISIINIMINLFKDQVNNKSIGNSLLIWEGNVIKEGHNYDTRPIYSKGDFQDFGHFNIDGYYDAKREFQQEFVLLYHNLEKPIINKSDASKIKQTVNKYCNEFEMKQASAGKADRCRETFYNIMTPFYDDIEEALYKTEDEEANNDLINSKNEIERLIYSRNMLTIEKK